MAPENLLRISIRLDAAPEGPVLRRLSLASRDGKPLHEPFLDQELWSPDARLEKLNAKNTNSTEFRIATDQRP